MERKNVSKRKKYQLLTATDIKETIIGRMKLKTKDIKEYQKKYWKIYKIKNQKKLKEYRIKNKKKLNYLQKMEACKSPKSCRICKNGKKIT